MKILFVITGIGLGHTIREDPVMRDLLKRKPKAEIHVAGFKTSYNYFRRFPRIKLWGHKFPEGSFNVSLIKVVFSNLLYPLFWLHDAIVLSKEMIKFNPDMVVVDIEPVGTFVGKLFNKNVICVYNLDLPTWRRFNRKNLSLFTRLHSKFYYNTIASCYKRARKVIIPTVRRLKSTSRYKYVNPIVRIAPGDLDNKKSLMKKLELDKKPVLVMLGGSKFGFSIVDALFQIADKFKEDFIVFGYYKPFTSLKKNFKIYSFTENFLEYLKVCKGIIIIAGHTTLMESLVYKKPALVLPFTGYVEHYLNVFGLPGIQAVNVRKITSAKIEKILGSFLEEIPKMQKKLKTMSFPGEGSKESVDILLKDF